MYIYIYYICVFSPNAPAQWQPDGLTIHANKWFPGTGFPGAPPMYLIKPGRYIYIYIYIYMYIYIYI